MLLFDRHCFALRYFLLVLCLGAFPAVLQAEYAEHKRITVVTEELAIGYRDKNDQKNMGITAIFVECLLREMNAHYEVKILPWSRALVYAKIKPNTLIFPIARTEDRESDYIWIGKVFPADYRLYKLKNRGDVIVNTLEDAKEYRIGVNNNNVIHRYLSSKGAKKLEAVNSDAQNLKKLMHGRLDLFVKTKNGMDALCKEIKFDCDELVPVLTLDEISSALYIAYGQNTDKNVIDRTRLAYENLAVSTASARRRCTGSRKALSSS